MSAKRATSSFLGAVPGVFGESIAGLLRLSIVPCLISVALLMALVAERPDAEWLHLIHLASAAAALLAFWCRLEALRRPSPAEVGCFLAWSALIGWTLYNAVHSSVREATFPYLILSIDGALLFYAAYQSSFHRPRLALLIIVLGSLFGLVGMGFVFTPGQMPSHRTLAVVFVGMALLLLALSTGSVMTRWRFRLSLALVVACFLGIWGGRAALWEQREKHPDALRTFSHPGAATRLAAGLFFTHPFAGIGLGAFELHLLGHSSSISRARWASAIRQDRPGDEGTWGEDKGLSSLFGRILRPLPRSPIGGFQLLVLEFGMGGCAIALVLALFLLMAGAYGMAQTPCSPAWLATAGAAALAANVLAEGFFNLSLAQPYSLLLLGSLGGVLWGASAACAREEKVEPAPVSFGDAEDPFREEQPPTDRLGREIADLLKGAPADRLGGGAWSQWIPVPRRWVSLLLSTALALLLIEISARPLRGLRLLDGITAGNLASEETGAVLERAGALNAVASEIPLRLASHLRHRMEGNSRVDSLAVQVEQAYRKALALNPFREEIWAARLEFTMLLDRPEEMESMIREGKGHLPRSLILSLWEARHATRAGDYGRLQAALEEAVRLAAAEPIPVQRDLRLRLAALYEQQGDLSRALGAAYEQLQSRPGDPMALEVIDRLSAR